MQKTMEVNVVSTDQIFLLLRFLTLKLSSQFLCIFFHYTYKELCYKALIAQNSILDSGHVQIVTFLDL